jgi:hypothetical protein
LSRGSAQGFEDKFDVVVRAASFSLTALLYAAVVVAFLGLEPRLSKLVVFVAILTVVPAGSAAAIKAVRHLPPDWLRLAELASAAIVMVSGATLAGISFVVWLFGISASPSNAVIRVDLTVLVLCHFLGLLAGSTLCSLSTRNRITAEIERLATLGGRLTVPVSFSLIVSAAMLLTFHIGTGNPLLNASVALAQALNPKPGPVAVALSLVLAAGVLAICFRLLKPGKEPDASILRSILNSNLTVLIVALLATGYLYFDYRFHTDVLHFLTNAGPASQIIFAHSVPMVTAFSQYGPGPTLMTWIAFLVGSPSFGAANVVAQLCSILFYWIMLVCLFRMTPYRKAAMWLGFFAIGVLLAGWWSGNGSLNSVPSAMGLRYLPNGVLVLALSLLPKGRQLSPLVFFGMVLSGLWSFETLAGSVAIIGLFILINSVRQRSLGCLVRGLSLGIVAPTATSVVLMSVMTLAWSGALPDYLAYLQFARVYNMISEFWSLDASGAFYGWVPVAATIMVVLTIAWILALEGDKPGAPFGWDVLIDRFVPMAALCGFMSSYFAGRSVDFTLIIAFLPLTALLIPGALTVFDQAISRNRQAIRIVAVPVLAIFVAVSFSFLALYRKDGPYSTAIAECLYRKNCSPVALRSALTERLLLRPMLDQAANPNFFDTSGLTKDAIALIERYAADRSQIALFLGTTTIWSVHTNAVLLLKHKGHRWPISYVLSDEINPSISQSIANAEVRLEEDEPVFIRSDESRLGPLEEAIVAKIRSSARLCPMPPAGLTVTAYRVTYLPQCDRGT